MAVDRRIIACRLTASGVTFPVDSTQDAGKRDGVELQAFAMPDSEKQCAELKPFSLTGDTFPKIIVRNDIGKSWYDEQGILNVGLTDFLPDRSIVD